MLLTQPIYRFVGEGTTIQYDSQTRGQALNFTGPTWIDHKWGLVKTLLRAHPVIVTDNDLLTHDDYMEVLGDRLIVFIYSDRAASKNRLYKAQAKLKAAGIRTKYFVSREALASFLERVKT